MKPPHALPLVMHLTYALDVGGLETLLVDCINRMPADQYRHHSKNAVMGTIRRSRAPLVEPSIRPVGQAAATVAFLHPAVASFPIPGCSDFRSHSGRASASSVVRARSLPVRSQ